ncbi:Single-stranded DNA-binding protein WHY1, chloroplastic [Zea mays]|uniref:Single-stranded DNA-binding protein WHY1, chloroplastic n=1 Tax=Zea mays TaxID=4577 RepID=A0A3L6EAT7_MAIZE|nr:Single-stranded DNA-binding protein WHY1, chloroplastic [Zea mays]
MAPTTDHRTGQDRPLALGTAHPSDCLSRLSPPRSLSQFGAMPPPAPLFLSLASTPPPALMPVHHPRAPQSLSLVPAVASSRKAAAVLACPVASPRHSDYFDPRAPPPPRGDGGYGRPPNGAQDGRVFTSYSIYKGKAALSFDPRPPLFVPLDSGAYKVAKEGFVLLQFAPAVATRQYDWTRKQVFSLSVWEIGTLLTLGPTDSCEFFHDPFKGRRLVSFNVPDYLSSP